MNEEKKYLTLEEAEKIVDDMYQKRWEECGVDDGNTIHMGNLDKLQYNELEKASILLLRTELRLQQENKKLKKQLSNSHQIKTQQKEFIELLENEIALRERKTYEIAIIKDDTAVFVWKIKLELLKEVLSKYKEIVGYKE